MMSKNVIYEAQFGFRTNHSTCHAIQHSVDFINKAHLTGKHVLGIFIDLSKDFDTINHSILLHKLYHYGVRGIAHSLLTSYLKNRHQYVKVNEEASNQLPVNFGVPQNSVLGSLLFLIYINDLHNAIKNTECTIISYADDTNIFIASETLEQATQLANTNLTHINEYMELNLLHINLDKSCFMYFPPKPKYLSTKHIAAEKCGEAVHIGQNAIKEVTEVKFLGVMLDPLINWNIQIQHLKKKLRTSFAVIKRISPFVPAISHKSLYHTLFESHLSYCISAWGMASKRYIDEIFTIQKTAIRYLFGDYDSFLDKFFTAARTRPYDEQQLGISFYQK